MFSGQVINFDRLLRLFKEHLLGIYVDFMQMPCEEKDLDVAILRTQMVLLVSNAYKNHSDRRVLSHSCITGNQGKMAGNSKICIGIQSQLILPEFIC